MLEDIDLSGEVVRQMVETIAYGERSEITSMLFGNDSLTDDQRRIPLKLLEQLHAPNADQRISVVDAGYQRPFWMLILNVPWFNSERAGPFYPLLVSHENKIAKIAGFVLPWNEISSLFSEDQQDAVSRLTAWWAIWLQDRNQAK